MPETRNIRALLERVRLFERNRAQYKSHAYDESNTRADFVDKLFECLGWDIDNAQGFSETYREVIREDKVRIEGSQKAPDYSFRIGGVRKFFVEAKRPSVNIKETAEPAYQVRRYAYTAKLPLSILTNFEEFAVYDTRIKPDQNDKASAARIFYCTFDQYEQHFDFIFNTFSKDAIQKGSFDKYVGENRNKKGTSEVDTELLALIEEWRIDLAKNIARNNPDLSIHNLNTIVQRTIDRIVFLRIAEDRGIEAPNQLLAVAKTENIYDKLIEIFIKADKKYNAGLFTRIDWIECAHIDDKTLSNIIVNLYYPECPYEFSVLPIEILGSIYERFLGKTIRFRNIKGDTHTAIIEEKPEVKKAGGVFYTPQYIVDYIVRNTVGEKLKNLTPREAANIKICDPACGSGSFLVGAYRYLLDYHLDYYTQAPNVKSALRGGKIFEAAAKSYKLTIGEKQRILTNSIFGVDVDSQAVEVTKLSLYLKLLENEGKEAEGWLFKYSDRTLLPSLEENIRCGNSLIGKDFYEQTCLELTDDELFKVNCFDWKDGFADILEKGGFDVVIGNPPYGAGFLQQEKAYLLQHFRIPNYQYDSYLFFIEKSIKLLKQNGLLGLIIPNTWLLNLTARELRKYLFSNIQIEKIAHYLNKVFKDAVVDTEIIIFRNSINRSNIKINIFDKEDIVSSRYISQKKLIKLDGSPINILERKEYQSIKDKVMILPKLDSLCKITQGTKPFQIGKGKPPQTKKIVEDKPYVSDKKRGNTFLPLLRGSMMNKYQICWNNDYWIKFGDWLAEPRYSASYDKEKIIIRQTGDSLIATYDQDKFIVRDNLYTIVNIPNINISLKYILGIINSKFLNWYYQNIINNEKGEALAQVKRGHLAILPIPNLNLSIRAEKIKHDKLVSLVDKMLELKKRESTERNQDKKSLLAKQISSIDNAIDSVVYELYGLSDEEIGLIEK